MENQLKDAGFIDDGESPIILPEIADHFAQLGRSRTPTFYDELDYLNTRMESHRSLGAAPNQEEYNKSYFDLQEKLAKHYVKNLDIYKKNTKDDEFRNIFLHGTKMGRHIPLSSMLPTSNHQRARGFRYIQIDDELEDNGKPLLIGFNPKSFPLDLTSDKEGKYAFKYGAITPDNTKFFPDDQTAAREMQPLFDLFINPQSRGLDTLISEYNSLATNDSDKLDPTKDPSPWMFRGVASLQLAKVNSSKEPLEFKPRDSKVYRMDTGDSEDGLSLDLSYYNLFSTFEEGADPTEAEEAANAYNESLEYWEKQGFEAPSVEIIKNQLAQKISTMRWEKMPEEAKQSVKQTLGALANFYPEIRTDIEGLGSLVHPSGNYDGYFDPKISLTLNRFINSQASLLSLEDPMDWNSNLHRNDSQGIGKDFLQAEADKFTNAIMRTMQRMMKYRSSKVDGEGRYVPPSDPAEAEAARKREMDLVEHSSLIIEGLGMQGASQEEMNQLVDIIAQYLELANQAALRGQELESWKNKIPTEYTKDGKKYLYDFKRRLGGTEISSDYWKEVGGTKVDPVYKLVTDFIADAENYVILAGRDGKKVVPLINWLGLETAGKNLSLPNRVQSIRLTGTPISNRRRLEQLEDGWFFKKPLPTKPTKGSSKSKGKSKTTKVVDLGDAAKVLKRDTNPETFDEKKKVKNF